MDKCIARRHDAASTASNADPNALFIQKPPAKSPHLRCFVIYGCFVPLRCPVTNDQNHDMHTLPQRSASPTLAHIFSRDSLRTPAQNEPRPILAMRRLEARSGREKLRAKKQYMALGALQQFLAAIWLRARQEAERRSAQPGPSVNKRLNLRAFNGGSIALRG